MVCCKSPKYTFSASLMGLAGTDCQKSGLNLKLSPKSKVFVPNDTLGVFLAHSFRKLWSLIGLPATAGAEAGAVWICFSSYWFHWSVKATCLVSLSTYLNVFAPDKQNWLPLASCWNTSGVLCPNPGNYLCTWHTPSFEKTAGQTPNKTELLEESALNCHFTYTCISAQVHLSHLGITYLNIVW